MIIKISKIISCTSEHSSYPSSNLLEHPPKNSWRCAMPNEVMATVIFQLSEPSYITGLEIGNYRSCFVVVEASTSEKSNKWIPIINHQFLSHDEAANSKFRDQVQLFTKWELNSETIKIKFNQVKVTCTQSANPREVFGLEFIILKTEVILDLGLDVFGQFKLKKQNDNDIDEFKEKYLKLFKNEKKCKDYKEKKTKLFCSNKILQDDNINIKKMPLFDVMKGNINADHVNSDKCIIVTNFNVNSEDQCDNLQKNLFDNQAVKKNHCLLNILNEDKLCESCELLSKPTPLFKKKRKFENAVKPKKEFSELLNNILFALSGYVNPLRNEIRTKALKMGARYIADPDLFNHKCTHLICCFKNTPKFKQLKGHCKIISHKFIEDCFNTRKRVSWRQYALEKEEKNQPESEEEMEENILPIHTKSIYEMDTDNSNS